MINHNIWIKPDLVSGYMKLRNPNVTIRLFNMRNPIICSSSHSSIPSLQNPPLNQIIKEHPSILHMVSSPSWFWRKLMGSWNRPPIMKQIFQLEKIIYMNRRRAGAFQEASNISLISRHALHDAVSWLRRGRSVLARRLLKAAVQSESGGGGWESCGKAYIWDDGSDHSPRPWA